MEIYRWFSKHKKEERMGDHGRLLLHQRRAEDHSWQVSCHTTGAKSAQRAQSEAGPQEFFFLRWGDEIWILLQVSGPVSFFLGGKLLVR